MCSSDLLLVLSAVLRSSVAILFLGKLFGLSVVGLKVPAGFGWLGNKAGSGSPGNGLSGTISGKYVLSSILVKISSTTQNSRCCIS